MITNKVIPKRKHNNDVDSRQERNIKGILYKYYHKVPVSFYIQWGHHLLETV